MNQIRTARGMIDIQKIIFQLFVPSAKMAIKIWPNPHPIDKNIGTEAREI